MPKEFHEQIEDHEPADETNAARSGLLDRLSRSRFERAGEIPPSPEDTERLRQAVEQAGPHDLSRYLDRINPHYPRQLGYDLAGTLPYTENCGSCARAFADVYQGRSVEVASGRIGGKAEQVGMMWDRLGTEAPEHGLSLEEPPDRPLTAVDCKVFTDSAWTRFADRTADLPDRSVIIVGVDWIDESGERSGGHWFNAIKDSGTLRWVDAQSGETSDWPPHYENSLIATIEAVHRAPRSERWEEVQLDD